MPKMTGLLQRFQKLHMCKKSQNQYETSGFHFSNSFSYIRIPHFFSSRLEQNCLKTLKTKKKKGGKVFLILQAKKIPSIAGVQRCFLCTGEALV